MQEDLDPMDLTKNDHEAIQAIFNDVLKNILNLPQTTSNCALLAETGYPPMEYIINRKRIMEAYQIHNMKDVPLVKQIGQHRDSK